MSLVDFRKNIVLEGKFKLRRVVTGEDDTKKGYIFLESEKGSVIMIGAKGSRPWALSNVKAIQREEAEKTETKVQA